ncbi:MAG: transglycosylase SLT domain-containing protein [Acidimicrobiales bacterium]
MTGHPIAADENPSLHSAVPAATLRSTPGVDVPSLHGSATTPDPATAPPTELVTAAAGETIWSIAERNGVAPGLLLRHNRDVHAGLTGAVDALASGQPLEQSEVLVLPVQAQRGERRSTADAPSGSDGPIIDDPDLAALEPVFDRWADHFGVPRDLLKALAWVESGWNNDTRSAGGGIGIGRLQPLRAQYLAEHVAGMALDPAVAVDNIALTAAQLRVLLDDTPDVRSAVAAHRQGITDTRLSGVDPMLDGYVEAVLTLRLRFA